MKPTFHHMPPQIFTIIFPPSSSLLLLIDPSPRHPPPRVWEGDDDEQSKSDLAPPWTRRIRRPRCSRCCSWTRTWPPVGRFLSSSPSAPLLPSRAFLFFVSAAKRTFKSSTDVSLLLNCVLIDCSFASREGKLHRSLTAPPSRRLLGDLVRQGATVQLITCLHVHLGHTEARTYIYIYIYVYGGSGGIFLEHRSIHRPMLLEDPPSPPYTYIYIYIWAPHATIVPCFCFLQKSTTS